MIRSYWVARPIDEVYLHLHYTALSAKSKSYDRLDHSCLGRFITILVSVTASPCSLPS